MGEKLNTDNEVKPSIFNVPTIPIGDTGSYFIATHIERVHHNICPCCKALKLYRVEFKESKPGCRLYNVACENCGFYFIELLTE